MQHDIQSKDKKYKNKVREDQTSCIQHALNRHRYTAVKHFILKTEMERNHSIIQLLEKLHSRRENF